MMMNTRLKLSADNFKSILSNYLDFDISDFFAYIGKNGFDNVLKLSSEDKGIRISFSESQIKDVLIDLFNKDADTKIDNINVNIINNTERDRIYVSIDCDISKECLKSIVDMIKG